MPKLGDMYFYGCEVDSEFTRIANELDKCFHIEEFGDCELCPYYEKCFRLFEWMSSRGAYRRLNENDVSYFRQKYQKLAGIVI